MNTGGAMSLVVRVEIPPCIYNVTFEEYARIVSEHGNSGDDHDQAVIESDHKWIIGLTPFDWDDNDNDLEGDW
jgi:hypothetical protein